VPHDLAHPLTIRPATLADLPAIRDIRYESDIQGDPSPPPKPPPAPYLRLLMESGSLLVAEREGRVVGHAGLICREGMAYLSDLFIRGDSQSGRIGRRLLHEILPSGDKLLCTMASTDHGAVALYARAGMQPRWPHYVLAAHAAELRDVPTGDVEIVTAAVDDPALGAWDDAASGRPRPMERAFWAREEQAAALWFRRGDETVGYGFVRPRAFSYAHGHAVAVGPIGARSADDAAACVLAAADHACITGAVIELSVPGPHPALAPLFEVGFRITYIETYCAGGAGDLVDPRTYVSSGSDLF
jgi:hypothetical protein